MQKASPRGLNSLDFLRPRDLRPIASGGTSYRPDIDGVRAIAIMPVLLFHAGVKLCSGGFVGVDIFFVISGFLIGRIVVTRCDAGSFSFADFYDRRVRRIVPPLLIMIATTFCMGYFLLLPKQLHGLGFEALTAELFGSNLWFWHQAGYFQTEAKLQALLHTWSLGIEEQFYLVFPAVVVIVCRTSRRFLVPTIFVILTLSLVLSLVALPYYPSADFFLLPTRAWELLTGVLLAMPGIKAPATPLRAGVAAGAGILFMLIPVVIYTNAMPYPGERAIVPVAGAGLAVWAGMTPNSISRLLAARQFVFIGLISYSLYLWHWPVFLALRQMSATLSLDYVAISSGTVVSFILAMLSVRFVEGPFRNRKTMPARLAYPLLGLAAGAIAMLSIWAIETDGAPARLPSRVRSLAAGSSDFSPAGRKCLNVSIESVQHSCRIGAKDAPASFVLWGDSHAAALSSAVSSAATAHGRAGFLLVSDGCVPIPGYRSPDLTIIDQRRCGLRIGEAAAFLSQHPEIRSVVLSARWQRGPDVANEPLVNALADAVEALRRQGKQATIIAGLPSGRFDVPWGLATAAWAGRAVRIIDRTDETNFFKDVAGMARAGRLRLINLAPAFCNGYSCSAEQNGHALFADDNHISEYGAVHIASPLLKERLFSKHRDVPSVEISNGSDVSQ